MVTAAHERQSAVAKAVRTSRTAAIVRSSATVTDCGRGNTPDPDEIVAPPGRAIRDHSQRHFVERVVAREATVGTSVDIGHECAGFSVFEVAELAIVCASASIPSVSEYSTADQWLTISAVHVMSSSPISEQVPLSVQSRRVRPFGMATGRWKVPDTWCPR